jgi:hypothetical protein
MGVPAAGTVQEQYSHHLRYDGVVPNPVAGACFTHDYNENLLGHRSGVGNATPWSTPPVRSTPSAYQDAGTAAATTATTLDDTSKVWIVNQWVGKTVFAIGTGGAITKLVITSNDDDTATGSGGWSNGTPAGTAVYALGPDALAAGAGSKFADNWWQQLRLLYNPASL